MKLKVLKPRLSSILTNRIPTLTTETANPRPSGRAWQKTRARIQVEQDSLCADCGLVWNPATDHVDHDTPRWKGGSDEDGNLKLRCLSCHEAKSKAEAAERAAMGRQG